MIGKTLLPVLRVGGRKRDEKESAGGGGSERGKEELHCIVKVLLRDFIQKKEPI